MGNIFNIYMHHILFLCIMTYIMILGSWLPQNQWKKNICFKWHLCIIAVGLRRSQTDVSPPAFVAVSVWGPASSLEDSGQVEEFGSQVPGAVNGGWFGCDKVWMSGLGVGCWGNLMLFFFFMFGTSIVYGYGKCLTREWRVSSVNAATSYLKSQKG